VHTSLCTHHSSLALLANMLLVLVRVTCATLHSALTTTEDVLTTSSYFSPNSCLLLALLFPNFCLCASLNKFNSRSRAELYACPVWIGMYHKDVYKQKSNARVCVCVCVRVWWRRRRWVVRMVFARVFVTLSGACTKHFFVMQ
jgi:hypothetical protein